MSARTSDEYVDLNLFEIPQFIASTPANWLLFDLGIAAFFPGIIIPAMVGIMNEQNAGETLSITPHESSWLGNSIINITLSFVMSYCFIGLSCLYSQLHRYHGILPFNFVSKRIVFLKSTKFNLFCFSFSIYDTFYMASNSFLGSIGNVLAPAGCIISALITGEISFEEKQRKTEKLPNLSQIENDLKWKNKLKRIKVTHLIHVCASFNPIQS